MGGIVGASSGSRGHGGPWRTPSCRMIGLPQRIKPLAIDPRLAQGRKCRATAFLAQSFYGA